MKVAILAEGQFARATAKTAIGVLRYAPFEVVAVVDSTRAGKDAAECVGVGRGVPVVAGVAEAIARGATVLLIGTAAAGGRIPDGYRSQLTRALEHGVEVWNGLHERVFADPDLAAAAERGGAKVRELREPPADLPIGGHRARREGARVVLTVGSDAAVGKMTASLEVVAALRRMGERAEFVAAGRRRPGYPPARVVAVALNTADLSSELAEAMIQNAATETGLPAADPVREGPVGADRLAQALREAVPA